MQVLILRNDRSGLVNTHRSA